MLKPHSSIFLEIIKNSVYDLHGWLPSVVSHLSMRIGFLGGDSEGVWGRVQSMILKRAMSHEN